MITMGAMASKPEDNSILVDDDDDDNDQQVIEVPSDADFSATDSVDDYIPISSASSSEEDSDRPRSRRSTGSRRSSSVTSSSARRRERPPQQQVRIVYGSCTLLTYDLCVCASSRRAKPTDLSRTEEVIENAGNTFL